MAYRARGGGLGWGWRGLDIYAPLRHEPRVTRDFLSALTPIARRMDPETAHGLGLRGFALGLGGTAPAPAANLATTALGLTFATPIGLAAGFDKDGVALAALRRLGFGFVEAGTVTRRPQPGNPRPRLFRLAEDGAVINRMGFNNAGAAALAARLAALPAGARPIGVNLGLNKEGAEARADYAYLAERFAGLADYLVINVSSPNTPGLRDLQAETRLAGILRALPQRLPPVLVKLAPDLADAAIAPLVETCIDAGAAGLILTNTTLARPAGLRSAVAAEAGGLSGTPLFARATRLLALAARAARGRLTLIGVGGVASGADVLAKLRAGASLVQLYTGFAYGGPTLPARLNRQLAEALDAADIPNPSAAIGTEIERWMAEI